MTLSVILIKPFINSLFSLTTFHSLLKIIISKNQINSEDFVLPVCVSKMLLLIALADKIVMCLNFLLAHEGTCDRYKL